MHESEQRRREMLARLSPEAASEAAGVYFYDAQTGRVVHPNDVSYPEGTLAGDSQRFRAACVELWHAVAHALGLVRLARWFGGVK